MDTEAGPRAGDLCQAEVEGPARAARATPIVRQRSPARCPLASSLALVRRPKTLSCGSTRPSRIRGIEVQHHLDAEPGETFQELRADRRRARPDHSPRRSRTLGRHRLRGQARRRSPSEARRCCRGEPPDGLPFPRCSSFPNAGRRSGPCELDRAGASIRRLRCGGYSSESVLANLDLLGRESRGFRHERCAEPLLSFLHTALRGR